MTTNPNTTSRRSFFSRMFDTTHGLALASLLSNDLYASELATPLGQNLSPQQPHSQPRARTIIHFCMQGGPSQVDLFDPKPTLTKFHGKAVPRSLTESSPFERDRKGQLMGSPWKFAKHGQSGADVSELLPHIAKHVDDLAIVRSMYNVHSNHEPALHKMQTGKINPGHPSFGSWITYGLGNESNSLPAYVVLADPKLPTNGVINWKSGYLPPLFEGTPMRTSNTPLLNLKPEYIEPQSVTAAKRDLLNRLDQIHLNKRPNQPQLQTRISNYELAARMQLSASDALDIKRESTATLESYGIGQKHTDAYGRKCLLARRLVERGVRFIQLYTRGQQWDNHRGIHTNLPQACLETDQPIAALLADLKQRGLLDSTLLVWGGEFGRTPMSQNAAPSNLAAAGRDHGPYGYSIWMAGGGIKPGVTHGATDEIGYAAVQDRVSIQDWHATMLHLMGLNHQALTYNRNGLPEKLTHVYETKIIKQILA